MRNSKQNMEPENTDLGTESVGMTQVATSQSTGYILHNNYYKSNLVNFTLFRCCSKEESCALRYG